MLKTGLDGVATDLMDFKSDYENTNKNFIENLVPAVKSIELEWKEFKDLGLEEKVQELSDAVGSAASDKSLELLKLKDMVNQQSEAHQNFTSNFEEINKNASLERSKIQELSDKLNVTESKLNDVICDIGDQLDQSARNVEEEIVKSTKNLKLVANDLQDKLGR